MLEEEEEFVENGGDPKKFDRLQRAEALGAYFEFNGEGFEGMP